MRLDHWVPPLAIAHRGSRYLWPENTMEAFSGAVSLGYRYLETDLHLTADGVIVCIHDSTVDRTTDGAGPVAAHTLAELSRLDAGFRHRGREGRVYRGRGVRVPTLEEVALSFPEASLVVDLKADGVARPLAALIDRMGWHHRLVVGSFSGRRLTEFRAASGGRVATSAGPNTVRGWLLASRIGLGLPSTVAALQVPRRLRGVNVVDRRLLDVAHDRGLQVHVWTINHPEEIEELLDLGVDGIVSDRPDLLKEVLVERGRWS